MEERVRDFRVGSKKFPGCSFEASCLSGPDGWYWPKSFLSAFPLG